MLLNVCCMDSAVLSSARDWRATSVSDGGMRDSKKPCGESIERLSVIQYQKILNHTAILPRKIPTLPEHTCDVEAGREGLSVAGEQHTATVRIGVQSSEHVAYLTERIIFLSIRESHFLA